MTKAELEERLAEIEDEYDDLVVAHADEVRRLSGELERARNALERSVDANIRLLEELEASAEALEIVAGLNAKARSMKDQVLPGPKATVKQWTFDSKSNWREVEEGRDS